MTTTGPNSPKPTTGEIVGGVYNAAGETLVDGQGTPLQTDVHGNLLVNVAVGGGGGTSNVNLIGINGTPPALTNPLPVELSDGTNPLGTPGNPLNVSVTSSATPQVVVGNKTNNNAVPGATNVGVLPAIANAVAPAYTEGDQVLLSTDLAGVLRENVAEWGGTAVTAAETTSTVGVESAPVVRSTLRKFGQIITQTPLAANGVFTSAWFDTNSSGGTWVGIRAFANVASATNGMVIQVTDDTTNTNTQFTVAFETVGANLLTTLLSPQIASRYWRVIYTNGVTLQTTFELVSDELTNTSGQVLAVTTNAGFIGGTSLVPVTSTFGSNSTCLDVALLTSQNSAADGNVPFPLVTANGSNSAGLVVFPSFYGGGTQGNGLQRTPTIFKTASATASGNTAVWTPAAGKKFRLMRFKVQLTANATLAAAAVLTVSFQDSATGLAFTHDFYVGQVALTAATALFTPGEDSGWIDLGNGFASALANNVLNVNLSATLTSGNIRVIACGTEE